MENCQTDLTILSGDVDFDAGVAKFGWGCCIIGTVLWILGYVFVACFNAAVIFTSLTYIQYYQKSFICDCFEFQAENQVHRVRCAFFNAILRQEIGWYDTHETGDFASRMTE